MIRTDQELIYSILHVDLKYPTTLVCTKKINCEHITRAPTILSGMLEKHFPNCKWG